MVVQDIVTRYASTTGHHVIRRFGWDCHGLPVEYEIDKKLGAWTPPAGGRPCSGSAGSGAAAGQALAAPSSLGS